MGPRWALGSRLCAGGCLEGDRRQGGLPEGLVQAGCGRWGAENGAEGDLHAVFFFFLATGRGRRTVDFLVSGLDSE